MPVAFSRYSSRPSSAASTTTTDRDLLRRAGELLHGRQWQRAIARSLGAYHPGGQRDSLDDRLVRRWVAGDRPVPAWVWPALADLLDAERRAHGERTRTIAALAREIRRAG